MEAHLCSLCTSVVLYPHSQQKEDQEGRLIGFVELNSKVDCDVDTIRLRLTGKKKSVAVNAFTAFNDGRRPLQQIEGPFSVFLVQEGDLYDVYSGEKLELTKPREFPKGKHTLAYEIKVPRTMPPSQDNQFEKVLYELTLYLRGHPSRKFFHNHFTQFPVQSVAIEVHPSADGTQGVNRVDIGFKTSTESQQDGILEANLSSSNARMGGCFNLILQKALNKEEQDVIKVVDLNLTLEQIWIIKGERAEAATLTQIIADMSSFKRDCIEKGGLTIPVNGQVIPGEESKLSDHLVSHSDAGSHSLSVVPPPPAYEQQENINDSKVQRIKFHNYFPSSTDAKDSSKEIRNTGWQASTPIKTRDDVRIEHILNLLVKYVTKGGQEEPREIKMTAPIALVTETFRTEALQLPKYTTRTVIEPESVITPPSV